MGNTGIQEETKMTGIRQTIDRGVKAKKAQAVTALLMTMFFWGTSAVFMRTTALTLTPENALALRYGVLVLMVVPGLLITGGWAIAREHWPRLILTAIGMFGSSWFTIQGFARVAAGLGSVISMVEPIIIALLFWAILREPLSSRIWAGLFVSLVGSAVLFWPDITTSTANPVDGFGILFLLAAPICWAVYTIGAKPLLSHYSGFAITGWSMLLATPLILLMASKPYAELVSTTTLRTWAELVYLAAFNSLLGAVLWNYGTRHLPGAAVGSFLYLLPVIAVGAGYLILGEPITPWLVAGGAIMLAGVALAQSSHAH
jgi:drug/metabolite transporter (DMT)-like permease